jgi:1-aminocyclopropane-1-carboxylate deaminase
LREKYNSLVVPNLSHFLQTITFCNNANKNVSFSILRLDQLHSIISGNKWFKLVYYLEEVVEKKFPAIATFGGYYSNHIAATAFACLQANIKSIGIIRGTQPPVLSHTLQQALQHKMELHFVPKTVYKNKESIVNKMPSYYWIPEGGYGIKGMLGAALILKNLPEAHHFSYILTAVGSGTTLAGLIHAALPTQQVWGISVMKNNFQLEEQVNNLLLPEDRNKSWKIFHSFHQGGYAKHSSSLFHFMNQLFSQQAIPTDFVYTAKTFYAAQQLLQQNAFAPTSKVLIIHTGGLQGNYSLPKGLLHFL